MGLIIIYARIFFFMVVGLMLQDIFVTVVVVIMLQILQNYMVLFQSLFAQLMEENVVKIQQKNKPNLPKNCRPLCKSSLPKAEKTALFGIVTFGRTWRIWT